MSDTFSINTNQQAPELMPPDKRDLSTTTLVQSLLSAYQWLRDLIFGSYKTGATALNYAAGVYNKYDQVQFQNAIYECLVDGTATDPTDLLSWRLIQTNFIGVDERIQYDSKKLLFEWSLNKWFHTQFREPVTFNVAPDYYLPKSDIFLVTNVLIQTVFRVGLHEADCSSVGRYTSTEAVGNDYNFATQYGLTINVPAAAGIPEIQIRNFADKYVPAGVFYNVNFY